MPDYLYIHIPFCLKKCIYCNFFSVIYEPDLAKKYINTLCEELLLKKDLAGSLKSIYIGGGTPSLLPDECLKTLFNTLRDNYRFSYETEITVEANPGTISKSSVDSLLSCGINRFSIGVQSFDDNDLKTLGRIHNSEDAEKGIKIIKDAGIKNFSIDLIYGIPGQKITTWNKTLVHAIDSGARHISTYELTPEEKSVFLSLVEKEKILMPDEDIVIEMYNQAIDFLMAHSYEQYEISNFAMPGHRCIHNINYWECGEYIGIGAGAHSYINGIRSKNVDNLTEYFKRLSESADPSAESMMITPEEHLKEYIFLGLRKTNGIMLEELERYGIHAERLFEKLFESGLLEIKDNFLRLTRKGIIISNSVITEIFRLAGL